ncbi:hypothetical protein J6590_078013 [Homalodisca vitripennis]|nr:hypothetical protein J6590_078013 [Homalodisca vitripennis]
MPALCTTRSYSTVEDNQLYKRWRVAWCILSCKDEPEGDVTLGTNLAGLNRGVKTLIVRASETRRNRGDAFPVLARRSQTRGKSPLWS